MSCRATVLGGSGYVSGTFSFFVSIVTADETTSSIDDSVLEEFVVFNHSGTVDPIGD